ISCSSSLLDGCDEPEILRYENIKSVPWVLTSDMLGEPMTWQKALALFLIVASIAIAIFRKSSVLEAPD
ncbi:hypothetical protein N5A93_19205, partial [Roseovarius sp. EGI FJ00037]|uniref:hypothetical protein n=1 Tax=Roseovarius salincola TaxID=2978479 RepID=UPI0022A84A32